METDADRVRLLCIIDGSFFYFINIKTSDTVLALAGAGHINSVNNLVAAVSLSRFRQIYLGSTKTSQIRLRLNMCHTKSAQTVQVAVL